MRRPALCSAFSAAVVVAACGGDLPPGPYRPPTPAIEAATVAPGPHNALSAVVSLRALRADSAAVRFRLAGDLGQAERATPAVRIAGDTAAIPLLGLLPVSSYVARVVTYGPGGLATSDSLPFETDTLPSDLPRYEAGGPDPSPGYVVFAAGHYGLAIDNTGRVVWYHRFPDGAGLAFMAQPNGRYTVRPPTPDPADVEPWMEVDALGDVTRTLGCAAGLRPRPHDLIAEPDGSYWLMCDETRTMDLSASGGLADARVTGTMVQHVGSGGNALFQWSPFDHFEITDLDPAQRTGASVNWTHGNSIDLDASGHLIVSFRSLSEVTSIDTATGAVIWRLGGRRNEFRFEDTPFPAFAGQHSARAVVPGALLLLDNVGDPAESRAERYAIDEAGRTARLVRSYSAGAGVFTQIGGSVQDLPGGRTLVSIGTAGRVEEYDGEGRVTWRLTGNPGYVFRAQRIRSLYAPGAGGRR